MNIHKYAILVVYTNLDHLTKYHIERFQQYHPGTPVIPICHQDFPELSHWKYDWMWAYCDNIVYRWFLSKDSILADRYFIFDYDAFCNDSVLNVYNEVWDKQFAASDHFSYNERPDWVWFEKYKDQLIDYTPYLHGIVPMNGLMISHDYLRQIIAEQINNTVWSNIISELRVGTICKLLNLNIDFIYANPYMRNNNTPFASLLPANYLMKKGIFHPVKIVAVGA